jgi:hypothetical protein
MLLDRVWPPKLEVRGIPDSPMIFRWRGSDQGRSDPPGRLEGPAELT